MNDNDNLNNDQNNKPGEPPAIPDSQRTMFLLLSIFIAPAGLAIGAYNMSKDTREHRELGRTMLIISLVSVVASVICCCGFYMLLMNNFPFDAF